MPPYPELRRGEDTPVIQAMQIVRLDAPHLYQYRFHGENTFDEAHWQMLQTGSTLI